MVLGLLLLRDLRLRLRVSPVTAAAIPGVPPLVRLTSLAAVPAVSKVHEDHASDEQDPDPVRADEFPHHVLPSTSLDQNDVRRCRSPALSSKTDPHT